MSHRYMFIDIINFTPPVSVVARSWSGGQSPSLGPWHPCDCLPALLVQQEVLSDWEKTSLSTVWQGRWIACAYESFVIHTHTNRFVGHFPHTFPLACSHTSVQNLASYIFINNYTCWIYLQPTCMKLGTGELYPIHVSFLGISCKSIAQHMQHYIHCVCRWCAIPVQWRDGTWHISRKKAESVMNVLKVCA